MRIILFLFLLIPFNNAAFAVLGKEFKIVSDTKKPVEGKIYVGSCHVLEKKTLEQGKASLATKMKDKFPEAFGENCSESQELRLKAKEGSKTDSVDIGPGQWAIFFKEGMNPEGLVPAYCFADPDKPGRILRLYTPKSENMRKKWGRSMGFGLACEQVEKLP